MSWLVLTLGNKQAVLQQPTTHLGLQPCKPMVRCIIFVVVILSYIQWKQLIKKKRFAPEKKIISIVGEQTGEAKKDVKIKYF